MAKRKHHKKVTHRRRRVGAVKGSFDIMPILFGIGGAVAGKVLVNFLPASMNDKVKAAIPLAVGVAAPMFVKSQIVKEIGLGMGIVGGISLLQSFNVIHGIGSYTQPLMIAGITDKGSFQQSAIPTVGAIATETPSYTY